MFTKRYVLTLVLLCLLSLCVPVMAQNPKDAPGGGRVAAPVAVKKGRAEPSIVVFVLRMFRMIF